MVFSSAIFLFAFLVVTLIAWFLTHKNIKLNNIVLTILSLGFYAWGEPRFVLVMILSILMNWLFGLWVDRRMAQGKSKKPVIALMCVFNVGMLSVFKYLTFILRNLKLAFFPALAVPEITLPIGISFFTFQAMSYVIDVSRGKGKVRRDLLGVALYISFFPQLIAGPIVRYSSISKEIDDRRVTLDEFTLGVKRFLIGFCKKVLLANTVGLLVSTIFSFDASTMSGGCAWMGALGYFIQVYYDFGGYSDMAIGLGLMFGFHFSENFVYPFVSSSIGGFWRRWHISLGSWFRDYVYIPMGGSRVGKVRLAFNIFVTWTLTGLWHGADWTFILWGAAFSVVLIIERMTPLGKAAESHAWGHIYTLLVIIVLSLLQRVNDLGQLGIFYRAMFGLNGKTFFDSTFLVCVREYGLYFAIAFLFCFPVIPKLKERLASRPLLWEILSCSAILVLTYLSVSYIAGGSYNPFIYYNF